MPNESVKIYFPFSFPLLILTLSFFRVSQKFLDFTPQSYFLRSVLPQNALLLHKYAY